MVKPAGLEKDIARLLRFLGHAGCACVPGDAGTTAVVRPDGASHTTSDHCLATAARRGLVHLRDRKIYAMPEARSWLRRHMAAREEAHLDQHRIIEIARSDNGNDASYLRINAAESPLALMARLKDRSGSAWFGAETISAGERLARDFHFANLQPRLTQSYEPRLGASRTSAPGAGVELKDNVVAARRRVALAVEALGPELSGVALDICCFEKGLEMVERERQWPARSAKLMLKTALLQLHRHYNPPLPRQADRSHHWGGEGYRPEFGD